MEIPNKKCQASVQNLVRMWYSMQATKNKLKNFKNLQKIPDKYRMKDQVY